MDQSMPMYPHTHRSQTLSQLPCQRIGMHVQTVSLTTVKGNVEKSGSPMSDIISALHNLLACLCYTCMVLHVHLTTIIIGSLNKEKCPNYLCTYKREGGALQWYSVIYSGIYHQRCVKLSKKKAESLMQWFCAKCQSWSSRTTHGLCNNWL